MLYLSKILGARVQDSADRTIGKLKDIVIRPQPGVYAPLQALCVKDRKSKKFFYLPYHYVENIGTGEVNLNILQEKFIEYKPVHEDILLLRDVMDQQIVDTAGARVVRVNDLHLGEIDKQMCVLGIDISTRGLLRRLGLTDIGLFNWLHVDLIDWKQAQPIKGTLKLETFSKDLVKLHPADLANIVEDLNVKQGSALVQALDPKIAAKILEEINPRVQKILVQALGPEKAAKISERMSIDEVVDLIKLLPYGEAKEVCASLQNGRKDKLEKLISYKDDTAGGLMTTEFISARPEWTIEQVIEEIKNKSESFRSILYIYVLDKNGAYKGVVSLRRLLTAEPGDKIANVMKKAKRLPCVKVHQHVREIGKLMTKYDLNSVAVVDHHHHLLGVVTIDDVMRHFFPHA